MHGHRATVLSWAFSYKRNSQAAIVQIVVGRSATLGNVAMKRWPYNASPMHVSFSAPG